VITTRTPRPEPGLRHASAYDVGVGGGVEVGGGVVGGGVVGGGVVGGGPMVGGLADGDLCGCGVWECRGVG
jgi:hypothetical protein